PALFACAGLSGTGWRFIRRVLLVAAERPHQLWRVDRAATTDAGACFARFGRTAVRPEGVAWALGDADGRSRAVSGCLPGQALEHAAGSHCHGKRTRSNRTSDVNRRRRTHDDVAVARVRGHAFRARFRRGTLVVTGLGI